MTFPLYYILFPFLILLFIWVMFSLVALYHSFRYTFIAVAVVVVSVYTIGCFFIVSRAMPQLVQVDWGQPINLFSGMFSTNL